MLIIPIKYFLNHKIDISWETTKTIAVQNDFTENEMIAFSRQNTWKDFPVFWGERLELYSITDRKSHFVIENTKFNQTIQDPITICGDYIYYQKIQRLSSQQDFAE